MGWLLFYYEPKIVLKGTGKLLIINKQTAFFYIAIATMLVIVAINAVKYGFNSNESFKCILFASGVISLVIVFLCGVVALIAANLFDVHYTTAFQLIAFGCCLTTNSEKIL